MATYEPELDEILGFSVEIDGVSSTGWSSVTIPASSTEPGTDDGGAPWGQTVFQDLELERPFLADSLLYDWREAIRADDTEHGLKDVVLTAISRDGSELLSWEFEDTWIKHYSMETVDGSDDGLIMERVTLGYESMIRVEP